MLSSWAERGRGILRVNDKETPEGRSSRLVMRLLGNFRVVLNTKVKNVILHICYWIVFTSIHRINLFVFTDME